MQIGVMRERIGKAVTLASKIVSSKANLPILANLLMRGQEDNSLVVEASNLEVSLRITIAAKVSEPGLITVPAKKFTEYIATLTDDTLDLTSDKKTLVAKSTNSEARFVTISPEDYPVLPKGDVASATMLVLSSDLALAIKRTLFAAAAGDLHPVLSGILIEPDGETQANFVATDSFRLSLVQVPVQASLKNSWIVPQAALAEIGHVLSDPFFATEGGSGSYVRIGMSEKENQIFFMYNGVEVMARLLEAQFPDYRRVVANNGGTTVEVDRSLFIQIIRRSAIFASREGQALKIVFDPSSGITVSAQSVEVGSHVETIEATVTGAALTLGFNSRYLVEALDSFTASVLVLTVVGVNSPVLIIDPSAPDYQHVVMPMSLAPEG